MLLTGWGGVQVLKVEVKVKEGDGEETNQQCLNILDQKKKKEKKEEKKQTDTQA